MKSRRNQIEQYFEWWLDELIDLGYILDYQREPTTFKINDTITYDRVKRYKRKGNEVEAFTLFPQYEYTPDYLIRWAQKSEYLFYETVDDTGIFQFGKPLFIAHYDSGDIVSYVDVKPTSSVMRKSAGVSSSVTFPLRKLLMWITHHIYINKIVPIPMSGSGYSSALFIKTFTPTRYTLTDGGKQIRKIKWDVVQPLDFIKERLSYIKTTVKNTSDK